MSAVRRVRFRDGPSDGCVHVVPSDRVRRRRPNGQRLRENDSEIVRGNSGRLTANGARRFLDFFFSSSIRGVFRNSLRGLYHRNVVAHTIGPRYCVTRLIYRVRVFHLQPATDPIRRNPFNYRFQYFPRSGDVMMNAHVHTKLLRYFVNTAEIVLRINYNWRSSYNRIERLDNIHFTFFRPRWFLFVVRAAVVACATAAVLLPNARSLVRRDYRIHRIRDRFDDANREILRRTLDDGPWLPYTRARLLYGQRNGFIIVRDCVLAS